MIDRIRALFQSLDDSPAAPPVVHDKNLAAAVLMVEAATLDGTFDSAERETIRGLLESRFDISGGEVDTLLAEAETEQSDANHLLRFTRAIKDAFELEERAGLIEMLWEVAYADGVLHPYESNLVRRVSGLLYVSDRDSGAARKRVLGRLGIDDSGSA
jgi:uncharacterized tellurite resistance protein B-like protein